MTKKRMEFIPELREVLINNYAKFGYGTREMWVEVFKHWDAGLQPVGMFEAGAFEVLRATQKKIEGPDNA